MLKVTEPDVYVGARFTQRRTGQVYQVGRHGYYLDQYVAWCERFLDTCIGNRSGVAEFLNRRDCYSDVEILEHITNTSKLRARVGDYVIGLDFLNLDMVVTSLNVNIVVKGILYDTEGRVVRAVPPSLVQQYFESIYGYPIEVVYVGDSPDYEIVGILEMWEIRAKENNDG